MRKINRAVTILAFVALGATMMYAQATRTWVSGVGDDANPCSRTAPCKTFAGAIAKTAPGGEIDALDPGGFGALTITKPITLDGGGGQVASVLVAGTNGIVVAAGAGDTVIIRNLRLDGLGCSAPAGAGCTGSPGLDGIKFISGKDLNVENCIVFGFSQNGIEAALNQNTQATVHILNTITKNNAQDGIKIANAQAPPVQANVDESYALVDNIGIEAGTHSRVLVDHSFAETAAADAMRADDVNNDAQMVVEKSEASYSTNGINAQAGSTIAVGDSNVSFNTTCSLDNSGGTLFSFSSGANGTNRLIGATCGVITPKPQQ